MRISGYRRGGLGAVATGLWKLRRLPGRALHREHPQDADRGHLGVLPGGGGQVPLLSPTCKEERPA